MHHAARYPDSPTTGGARRGAALRRLRLPATLALALLIGWIVFGPQPVDASPDEGLSAWLRQWHDAGGPAWISYANIEFAANVLMFVPVGAVAMWWRPSVPSAALTGLACSCVIEAIQGLFLPDRVADVRDLVANTSGAFLGALVAAGVLRHQHSRKVDPGVPGSLVGDQ